MQYKSKCFIMPEVKVRSKLVPGGGLGITLKLLCLFKMENFDLSCILTKKYHSEKELQNKCHCYVQMIS